MRFASSLATTPSESSSGVSPSVSLSSILVESWADDNRGGGLNVLGQRREVAATPSITIALGGEMRWSHEMSPSNTSHLTNHKSHLTNRKSQITPHTSHVTPHKSQITPHKSHLTPHTSYITHHTSHMTIDESYQDAKNVLLDMPTDLWSRSANAGT
jgi:hypothetical protein